MGHISIFDVTQPLNVTGSLETIYKGFIEFQPKVANVTAHILQKGGAFKGVEACSDMREGLE